MKMNKKLLLSLFTVFMMLPIMVFAKDDIEIDFDGVKYAKPGDIVAYDIKMTVGDTINVSGFKANIEYDANILEYQESVAKGDWIKEPVVTNNLNFSLENGTNGTTTVATITFKVKQETLRQTTKITIKDIEVTTIDENEDTGYKHISDTFEEQLMIRSIDNTLKDLKVDGITLEEFASDKFEYNIVVDSEIDKLEIKATLNDSNASFVEEFGPREVEIDYGENEFFVKVKSESGDIQVYRIKIIRDDNRNTNNHLKEVIINSGKIKLELSKSRVDYVVKTYKLKELEIDAVAVDPKAEVKVEIPEEIIIGENIVLITVTSEMGEERKYSITFENSDKKLDTKLKNLYIKGSDIDFDKNTMVYEVVYNKKYKNGLDIKPVTVSDSEFVGFEIYYNGTKLSEVENIELKVGDKYEVRVHPLGMEEGDESETSTYTVTIVKDTRISFYLLLEVVIAIILAILITIQIFKKKKNNKTKNKKVLDKKIQEEINKTKVIESLNK